MSQNRLRIVGLIWSIGIIGTIWIDQWRINYLFSFFTCVLGAITLTSNSASTEKEHKESGKVGLVLLICGVLYALLEMFDALVIHR